MIDQQTETRYFEDYLQVTGWGLYYRFMVGLTCFFHLVHGMTFVTIPLATALYNCNGKFMPENGILRIFTSFYVGSCIGGLIGNALADRYGRKRYLSYSLLLIFVSTFTAAFAYNPYVITSMALFLGVGLELSLVNQKLLLLEVLPKESRGYYMLLCDTFWSMGYILTTVLTILFETQMVMEVQNKNHISITTWRIMFAVSGALNVFMASACALLEESPRFFLHMGRNYLAYLILKQLFAINSSSFAENFKVKEDDLKDKVKQYDLFYLEPESYWDIFKKLLGRFFKSLKLIFSKRFRCTSLILITLKVPILVLGILQLNILLSKRLSSKYRGLDFIYPVLQPQSYMPKTDIKQNVSMCNASENEYTFYVHFLIIGSSILAGVVISLFLVDKIGRKILIFSSLILCSCSFLVLSFVDQTIIQIIVSCVILASTRSITSTVFLINMESYPTAIRATCCSLTSCLGLFLAAIFINCIDIERQYFSLTAGSLYFCLSIFTFFLPELKGKPLVE